MNNETIDSTLAELTNLRSVGTVVFAQDYSDCDITVHPEVKYNFACVKNVVIGT